jgi:nucleoside-diphosphate-sugar epimerase
MRVVVTGGAGKLGEHVVRELVGAGHVVLSLDRVASTVSPCPSWVVDLTRAGDVYQALQQAEGVVHLAGWPAPNLAPDTETFGNNVTIAYNVLKAATDLGVDHVVVASSISAYGFSYAHGTPSPDYLPLDEEHPCTPQDPYGLSKLVAEQIAASCAGLRPMSIASLRIAGINFDLNYERFSDRWRTPTNRLGSFWSYVDARDAAVACRLALEASFQGHEVFNIAASTSAMPRPTAELVRHYVPGVKRLKAGLTGNWAGMESSKAERALGWRAQYRWEHYITSEGARLDSQTGREK